MDKRRRAILIAVIIMAAGLAVASAIWDGHYLLLSAVAMTLAMTPLFVRFERRRLEPREIAMLAALAAVAALGRIAFAPLPSFKPTSFVVIVAALVFGSEAGFIVGAVAALASNLFLGQGPWTPWQMFAWGMVGASAGWLRHTRFMKSRIGMCAFGLVWGFLFGWIMNVWSLLSLPDAFGWELVLLTYAQSFYFDLAHAVANVLFLGFFGLSWVRLLDRIRKKYGLLESRSVRR
ncbi:ECF transporter S component [Cohnella sp. GbtcB17]|uniref:ECF transporter S component n=1 Tax=Cohnella sp. GbtcB17 TaxID=2824762 RepID=UPI001C30695C|nr:ECF transporter S component [Cohnella sp. GbtcB17]